MVKKTITKKKNTANKMFGVYMDYALEILATRKRFKTEYGLKFAVPENIYSWQKLDPKKDIKVC